MRTLSRGLIAGAAGTVALDMVTYLDMALRGRPASTTPQRTVQRLAAALEIDLGTGQRAENRAAGIGALLGYATGLGMTLAYEAVTPQPWPQAAALLMAMAMLGSNVPMIALGVTDPRRWSAVDWAADVLPHLAYGAVAAAVDTKLRRTTNRGNRDDQSRHSSHTHRRRRPSRPVRGPAPAAAPAAGRGGAGPR